MKPPSDRFVVFVICDDPSHVEPQAVTNFVLVDDEDRVGRLAGHHWDELYPGSRRSGTDSAVTLIDNKRPDLDKHGLGDRDYWSRSRAVYELKCRKCRKPFQWRLERLFGVLDELHKEYAAAYGDTGTLPTPLQALSARIALLPEV